MIKKIVILIILNKIKFIKMNNVTFLIQICKKISDFERKIIFFEALRI